MANIHITVYMWLEIQLLPITVTEFPKLGLAHSI